MSGNKMLNAWLKHDFSDMIKSNGNPAYDIYDEDMEEYDSPYNSVWTVAVDIAGNVSVLDMPNIKALSDIGKTAEELGIPPIVDNVEPGIYEWICSYHPHIKVDDGHVEDWNFEVEKEKLLWSPYND